ncbi:MAG: class I SAM-dependent methyltransferase [Synechococcaceae cyanobacterium SM2_3_2]|nr:class I SAM-dependent methyltransferase [Synechococcaceae cyanobacterium SM2_3_2]
MPSSPDHQAQVRDFYEEIPYPNAPIPDSVRNNLDGLFKVNYTTAQYLRTHQIQDNEGTVMLNAGCGSGYETLLLAESNPGAKIIAMDISRESVKLTEQRLRYHGFTNAEYYVLDLRELPSLGYEYDFITCNDVLYLLDDPLDGLKSVAKVLKSDGILRTNFHHIYGRRQMLEAQEVFRLLGQFDLPKPVAMENVRNFLEALQPTIPAKSSYSQANIKDNAILANNFLLYGDKGYSILEVSEMLKQAKLGIVNLVDLPSWNLEDLFTEMPSFVADKIRSFSQLEQLHLFELLAPNRHRLIDFWAEQSGSSFVLPWSEEDWQSATLYLNPLLMDNTSFRGFVDKAVQKKESLNFTWPGSPSKKLDIPVERVPLIQTLLEAPTSVGDLTEQAYDLARRRQPREEIAEDVMIYFDAIEDFALVMLGSGDDF